MLKIKILLKNIEGVLTDIKKTVEITPQNEVKLVVDKQDLKLAISLLKDHTALKFNLITDIIGVDRINQEGYEKRFDVIYILTSTSLQTHMKIVVSVDIDEDIPSITDLFIGADWLEREVWDMFGIPFDAHPDLRRLLTDYGFEGHPLRKDFPVYGYSEVRYDEEVGKVIYEPVKLQQDYRQFNSLSPWEGLNSQPQQDQAQAVAMPGDEKANV